MRIKELDGLRGIAVLAVLDTHYLGWFPALGASFGWLGVDLFFVLSGFLITSILLGLRKQERYFTVFYSRRALRIFPPYFLGLAVYFAVALAMGKPGTWNLWLSYVFYYSSIVNSQRRMLLGAVVVPLVVQFGLAVLWSLSVEEIYYTIWAPIVRFTNEKIFAVILAAMIVAAPVLRWYLRSPDHLEIFTFYCRMDGLAYGSAVALLIRHRRDFPQMWRAADKTIGRVAAVFIPLCAIFLLITGGHESNPLSAGVGISLADLSFALAVYGLVAQSGGDQLWVRFFRMKWLRSIGMVSYSLYLFHYPIWIVSEMLIGKLHLSRHPQVFCQVCFGLVLSFAIAYGLWYGMESRILRWKDRAIPSPAHAGTGVPETAAAPVLAAETDYA